MSWRPPSATSVTSLCGRWKRWPLPISSPVKIPGSRQSSWPGTGSAPPPPVRRSQRRPARPRLLARMNAGEAVALVADAGTPLISDPGYSLVQAVIGSGFCGLSDPRAVFGFGGPQRRWFAHRSVLVRGLFATKKIGADKRAWWSGGPASNPGVSGITPAIGGGSGRHGSGVWPPASDSGPGTDQTLRRNCAAARWTNWPITTRKLGRQKARW